MQARSATVMEMSLDDKQRPLIEALMILGDGWHSRAELAAQLGKNRLNPSEITLLEVMAATGKIEKALHQATLPNNNQWVYRVKQD